MDIVINRERANEVFGILLASLERGEPPFHHVEGLDYEIPKTIVRGTLEHAIFLFCSCYYMRGKINSNTALSKLSLLYDQVPMMFSPKSFESSDQTLHLASVSYVHAQLMSIGLGFNSDEVSEHWVKNFAKLATYWHGDPREFFIAADGDYEKLCDILMDGKKRPDKPNGFYGFREKMVSMLAYFYIHAGITGKFSYPVPVDFHVLRMLTSHEILTTKDLIPGKRISFNRLSRAARQLTIVYCQETGTEPLNLANALWHTSREFCVKHPGNSSSIGEYKGRKTAITTTSLDWTPGQQRAFHQSCGRCSVESTCQWNIPSSNYYVQGVIVPRGKRTNPPVNTRQSDLFWK